MFCEQGVDLHPGLVAEHLADFGLGEVLGAVALDGEGYERGPRWVLAFGSELRGEVVRNVERHLHGVRIPLGVADKCKDELAQNLYIPTLRGETAKDGAPGELQIFWYGSHGSTSPTCFAQGARALITISDLLFLRCGQGY